MTDFRLILLDHTTFHKLAMDHLFPAVSVPQLYLFIYRDNVTECLVNVSSAQLAASVNPFTGVMWDLERVYVIILAAMF